MSTTLTIKERAEREQAYLQMIDKGMSVAEMAEKLGISKQAVRKFLKLRGWQVKAKKADPPEQEDSHN